VLRACADRHRAAARSDDDPPHAGPFGRVENDPRPVHVHPVELLGVLGSPGDPSRAMEDAIASADGLLHGVGVENVFPPRPAERHDLVPMSFEEARKVPAEKTGGSGDEIPHDA
jgi:hypothetical protein